MNPLARVHRECRRWGVRVLVVGALPKYARMSDYAEDWRPGPDAGGILWRSGTVVLWRDELGVEYAAEAFMHELAHVLHGGDPNRCDEVGGPMLAIEREAHRRLRLNWSGWMATYQIDEPWMNASAKRRSEILALSREEAETRGLMKDGKPTYRRTTS